MSPELQTAVDQFLLFVVLVPLLSVGVLMLHVVIATSGIFRKGI